MRALFVAATIMVVGQYAMASVEDDLREGDKYYDDGDYKKAAASYDHAINSAPGQVSAEAYGKRAGLFIILKDFKGGLEFIDKAKRQYPSAPEVLEQEALMLWETDRRDDAIKVAERVVKAKPSSFTNQQIIGEYYSGRQDSVKASAAFEAYLQSRPIEVEERDNSRTGKYSVLPHIRLGFAYLANGRSVLGDGDDQRAKQLYTKAVEQFEYVQRKLGKKPGAAANADNGLCAAYSGLARWDQAISVCERVIQDTRRIDSQGSAWYNLANAYLARKQTKKARAAGNEFTRMRKNEARGFMLIGDTFFEDRDWSNALDQYLRAEKLLRPNQMREQVMLSIRLGKTYRRLPAPPGGNNPNLALAIEKLNNAWAANPGSLELAVELGGAYLAGKQDSKAMALTDKVVATPEFAKAPGDQKGAIFVISGQALYNQKKLKEARARFEAARQERSGDVQITRYLVTTMNEQAFEASKNYKEAGQYLDEALKLEPNNTTTLTNIAVLAIERGDCANANRMLQKLNGMSGRDAVVTQRLIGRSYMCFDKPDVAKASAAFAAAESEAKKAGAQLALAEIYTEWAPLTWDKDLQGAVDKLELAVQASSQDPDIGPAAKRNLALALYRRGWQNMRNGKQTDAASDFERAVRDPNVLKGIEPLSFEFSYALALLDAGRTQDAAKAFKSLATKGNTAAYLQGNYGKVGTQYFTAYAAYRSAQSAAARSAACSDLAKLETTVGGRASEITASCWEYAAYDHWRAGSTANAMSALKNAEKAASADQKRRLNNNRTVANGLDKGSANELEALGGNPAEALVNLGIVYEKIGRPKDAYEAWVRAAKAGARAGNLQKWIEAKKRIYGY